MKADRRIRSTCAVLPCAMFCWARRSRSARCWLFLRWWRCAACSRALRGPLGFKPQGAMLAETDLSHVAQGNDAALEKEKTMMEAVRSLPGVTAVGMMNPTPLGGGIERHPRLQAGNDGVYAG